MSWIYRFVSAFTSLVLAKGLLLWLATFGIYPDQWVAKMLNWAATPEILSAITWTIAGLCGVLGLMFGPQIADTIHRKLRRKEGVFSLYQNSNLIPLPDAAQIAYDELDGTLWRTAADKWHGKPEERLDFMAA